MKDNLKIQYLTEIDDLLEFANTSLEKGDLGTYYPAPVKHEIISRSRSLVSRILGRNSEEYLEILRILKLGENFTDHGKLIIGVMKGLKNDIENDRLKTLSELIHADVFTDYLEMSEYLNDSGFTLASAVIVGTTLEAHLRQLCNKNSISLLKTKNKGKTIPKNAEQMNSDLRKADVYDKSVQKNVTAWLGTRNDAAHDNDFSEKYDRAYVNLYIANVRNFIQSYPA